MKRTRIDHLDNPDAPEVNSLIPAASVVAEDDDGRLLLIRRADNGDWAIPGGAMELGESLSDCAVREAKEETGIDVEITGLVGIFTNPNHRIEYTSNGEVRQEFSVVYKGRPIGGAPELNDEATAVEWLKPDELEGLQMHWAMRKRIARYLTREPEPYLG